MTRHDGRASKSGVATTERPRWKSLEAAEVASQVFSRALDALIEGDGGPHELTEAERLARRLGSYLCATIGLGIDDGFARTLRDAIAPFEREELPHERRAWVVQAVARAGDDYLHAASEEGRRLVVLGLARTLESCEEALEGAFGELDRVPVEADLGWLEERLRAYDSNPRGKPGKMGAEAILARIIALDVESSVLGLSPAEEEDAEDAIERIRKALAKAVQKSTGDAQTP